jgi:hypothetical protein
MENQNKENEVLGGVSFTTGDNPQGKELLANLNTYRTTLGYSWKTFILFAIAEYINNRGDNPGLVQAIIAYMQKPDGRSKKGK